MLPENASSTVAWILRIDEGRSERNERFAIKRYLLIIGKKENIQIFAIYIKTNEIHNVVALIKFLLVPRVSSTCFGP